MSKKTLSTAKEHLKKGGWSYRKAAPILGVSVNHLNHVLNGYRVSAKLLGKILDLTSYNQPKPTNQPTNQ